MELLLGLPRLQGPQPLGKDSSRTTNKTQVVFIIKRSLSFLKCLLTVIITSSTFLRIKLLWDKAKYSSNIIPVSGSLRGSQSLTWVVVVVTSKRKSRLQVYTEQVEWVYSLNMVVVQRPGQEGLESRAISRMNEAEVTSRPLLNPPDILFLRSQANLINLISASLAM